MVAADAGCAERLTVVAILLVTALVPPRPVCGQMDAGKHDTHVHRGGTHTHRPGTDPGSTNHHSQTLGGGIVRASRVRSHQAAEPIPQNGSIVHSGVAQWSNFSEVWLVDYDPSLEKTPLVSVSVPLGLVPLPHTAPVGVILGQRCGATAWNVPLEQTS